MDAFFYNITLFMNFRNCKPKSLDRNRRVIRGYVFLFHSSSPLFRHLAAVRISPYPAMAKCGRCNLLETKTKLSENLMADLG